jgi:outer membrane protein TolC
MRACFPALKVRPLVAGLVAIQLAGCASFSPDGGMSVVTEAARADLRLDAGKISDERQASSADDRGGERLKQGLTADRAVQVALLSNKGLQADYNSLGISEADYVAASLPRNPKLTLLDLRSGADFDIERRFVVDILSLLTLPARKDIAEAAYRSAELRAIAATLKLAADVRRQYWRVAAATAQGKFLQESRAAAEATSDLAKRLGETGATNKLDQSREHVFYAEVSAQLAKARTQLLVEREKLTRMMGHWGKNSAYNVPGTLPRLPGNPTPPARVESDAIKRNVDVRMARADLDRVAKELGLTRATRYVNALELSAAENSSRSSSEGIVTTTGAPVETTDRSKLRGVEIAIEIPLFDFGEARARKSEETYMRAANLLAAKAIDVRSRARQAYLAYRGAYDVARLYQSQVIPLRKAIQDESQLHYNGMLSDLFVLIQDARARITSNIAAIDAQRDFWIADADLRSAILGGGMGGDANIQSATSSSGAD